MVFSFTNIINPITVTPYLMIIMEVIICLSQIALCLQTYEWLTMLSIISYQRDKSLGEITYLLNNSGIRHFHLIELRNLIICVVIIVALIALKSFGTYFWLSTPGFYLLPGSVEYNCIELTDWIPFLFINIVFYCLVY